MVLLQDHVYNIPIRIGFFRKNFSPKFGLKHIQYNYGRMIFDCAPMAKLFDLDSPF